MKFKVGDKVKVKDNLKVGLQNGKRAFVRLFSEFKYKDIDIAFKQFKTRLEKYIYDCQGKDQQFILHFSTWINQKRWNDNLGD